MSPATALAATDATVAMSRLLVAERLALLKQQQIRLEAQRGATQADKALDDETRATTVAQLAVQRSRIDEQLRLMETHIANDAAEAAATIKTAAADAADTAAANRTAAADAVEAAAATRAEAPLVSHIHVVA
jgi:hypothetical protein